MFRLGAFLLGDRIGHGGSASVWAGRHEVSGAPVAVKVVDDLHTSAGAFQREITLTAGLHHHHIVAVVDAGMVTAAEARGSGGNLEQERPYLVMERAEATLRERPPQHFTQLRAVLLAILDALAHAHARQIVHRDLKSSNVLWVGDQVKVADFGIAHRIGSDHEAAGLIRGTPAFMAPEQFGARRHDYGPPTDLYALGCTAYALACGDPPFGRGSNFAAMALAHQHDPPPPLYARMPVPPELEPWLDRLMEKHPRRRYQLAADAAAALLAMPDPGAAGSTEESAAPLSTPTVPLSSLSPIELAPLSAPSEAAPVTRRPGTIPDSWDDGRPARDLATTSLGVGLYWLRSHPTVGRRGERDAMWTSLREVVGKRAARALLLQGAAGMGKSELARWIGRRANELGIAHALQARHDSAGGPAHGLVAMLQRHFRTLDLVSGEADDAAVAAQVKRLLGAKGIVEDDERETLGRLLDPRRPTPPMRVGERYALWSRVLESLARERALVVWLDDVHWEPDSIAFVNHFLASESAEVSPILFVMTARPDLLAARPAEDKLMANVTARAVSGSLTLGALGDAEMAELLGQVLPLTAPTSSLVATWSGGHPLYALQLLGDWVDEQRLRADGDGFALGSDEPPRPADVNAIGDRRLALALADDAAAFEALELAAALGRDVDGREWSSLCERRGLVVPEGLVDRLVARNLASTPPDGDPARGWAFAHGFVREILLRRAQSAGRLAAHHRLCAQMLGDLGANERVARHLAEAGDPRSAADPLLEVGAATRLGTTDFALADALLTERELALDRSGCPATDPRWGEGWLLRAKLVARRGNAEDARAWATTALDGATAHGWASIGVGARLVLAQLARRSGALDEARQLLDAASLPIVAEDAGLRGRCGAEQGRLLDERGELVAAERRWQQAKVDFEAAGDERAVADATCALGRVAARAGRFDEAMPLLRQARKTFRDLSERYGVGRCFLQMGDVARQRGDADAAEGYYHRALKRFRAVGAVDASAGCRLRLALLQLDRRATPGVIDELTRRREELEALGNYAETPIALVALMAAQAELAGPEAALELASELHAALARGLISPDVATYLARAAAALPASPLRASLEEAAAQQRSALGRR